MPGEPRVTGLLGLMLLTDARRPARVDGHGIAVQLEDQDRSLWDTSMIDEGAGLATKALTPPPAQQLVRPGRHRRTARRGAICSGDRLASGAPALRRAVRADPDPRRRPQPGDHDVLGAEERRPPSTTSKPSPTNLAWPAGAIGTPPAATHTGDSDVNTAAAQAYRRASGTRPDARRDRLPLLARRGVHHSRLNRYAERSSQPGLPEISIGLRCQPNGLRPGWATASMTRSTVRPTMPFF